MPVAPLSSLVLLFAGLSFLSWMAPVIWAAAVFGWLGGIRLLNCAAIYFPAWIADPIHWAHAMTFELLSFGCVLLTCPFPRLFLRGSCRENASRGQPILLVHGYLNTSAVWIYQKRKLENAHLGPVYTIDLGHPFLSIREYAEKVKAKADEIARREKRSDLILIGHSMGGLVSSWYATRLAEAGRVTDVITIASPFAGTPVARIGIGANAREMERGSLLIRELKAGMGKNKIRFYHIATKRDPLVIPGISAALFNSAPDRNFIFEDISHASLLYSPRVADWITESLLLRR